MIYIQRLYFLPASVRKDFLIRSPLKKEKTSTAGKGAYIAFSWRFKSGFNQDKFLYYR